MRKFIVSDIHGNGNIYNSIMGYLDNVNNEEEVTLYINGDLIDEGPDSAYVLLDTLQRIKNGPFKIVYLAGHQELLMYEKYLEEYKGIVNPLNEWYMKGGRKTDEEIRKQLNEAQLKYLVEYISCLDIYHRFDEIINDKPIVLVHAACPRDPQRVCDLQLRGHNDSIYTCLTASKERSTILVRSDIGHKDFFTIVGHLPNANKYGYSYDRLQNSLNIDGGAGLFASGYQTNDHTPLIEVKEDYLKILTFNNNNEIVYGNYFSKDSSLPFYKDELEKERSFLNPSVEVRKLEKIDTNVM